MKSISDVLLEAAALIERGWNPAFLALREGVICDPLDPAANVYGLYGALWRATAGDVNAIADALTILDDLSPGRNAPYWEEEKGRTKQQVVGLVRSAARKAWQSEQPEETQ